MATPSAANGANVRPASASPSGLVRSTGPDKGRATYRPGSSDVRTGGSGLPGSRAEDRASRRHPGTPRQGLQIGVRDAPNVPVGEPAFSGDRRRFDGGA